MSVEALLRGKDLEKLFSNLPFRIYVLIADSESDLNVKQAEIFQDTIEKPTGFKTKEFEEYFFKAGETYTQHWRKYLRHKFDLSKKGFDEDLAIINRVFEGNSLEVAKKDFISFAEKLYKAKKSKVATADSSLDQFKAYLNDPEGFSEFKIIRADEQQPEVALKNEADDYAEVENKISAKQPEQDIPLENAVIDEEVNDAPVEALRQEVKKRLISKTTEQKAPAVGLRKRAESYLSKITKQEMSATEVDEEREPTEYMPQAYIDNSTLPHWKKGKIMLKCVGVVDETHDVKTFRFTGEPLVIFNYKPGAFLTLGLYIDGKKVSRSYTISSSPSRPNFLEITIKRVEGGLVSNYMADNVKVGDLIEARGPSGKFTCFDLPGEKLLFLSAGSGVTPMMSMTRWLLDTGSECDIIFFQSARSDEDIIYSDELNYYAATKPNFRLVTSLTRQPDDRPWNGLKGRINLEMLTSEIAFDFYQRKVFSCGPDAFMENVFEILNTSAFDMANYLEERFNGSPKKKREAEPKLVAQAAGSVPGITSISNGLATAPATAVTTIESVSADFLPAVHFAKSGLEVFGGDMSLTILDLAEELDIDIPSSCRIGSCGSCKVLLKKGITETDDEEADGLSAEEINEGYILTCITHAKDYVDIEA